MSAKEFAEWVAFFELEPWGWEADSFHAAMVSAMIANTVRDPKKRRRPWEPADFMPIPDKASDKKPVDQDHLRQKIDAWMIAFGGKRVN